MTKSRTNADNVTADIAGITAGTGITGGGTSGTVTITNDMATTIAAKGDILAGTANDAYSALTVGTNGQVLTAASGEATGLQWATPAGGGKVLQVVNATTATEVTIASTTMTDTGLTATITPTSATSKILILTSQVQALVRDSQNLGGNTRLMRDSTELFSSRQVLNMTLGSTDTALVYQLNFSYLDSPATTSATTYKTQGKVTTTANNSTNRFNETLSSITLLEIGA